MTHPLRKIRVRSSPALIGVLIIATIVSTFVVVYNKESLGLLFKSGTTVTAEFNRQYKLTPPTTEVKIAGVAVGTVTDVEKGDRGRAVVSMNIDDGAADKLGSAPSAAIRPTTVLGGKYYVELEPDGDGKTYTGATIPVARTTVPVELDRVLAAVPPPAQKGIQTSVKQLDRTLAEGGREAAQDLIRDAPSTLRPAGSVLQAARGTRPETDLSQLVTNVDSLAETLTNKDGQLGDTVDSLSSVSADLAHSSRPLAKSVADLPGTLRSTRSGVKELGGTLDKLTATANDARPSIQELGPLLDKADPVIGQARPLVSELRPLLTELRPTVDELVPTADRGTRTLNNLAGPVLDRVTGPITKTVLSPWHGKGFYEGGGSDNPFYKEVGFLAARAANLSKYADNNGAMIALAAGAGASSAGGTNITLNTLLGATGVLPPDGGGTLSSPREPEGGHGQLIPGSEGGLGGLLLPKGLPPAPTDNDQRSGR